MKVVATVEARMTSSRLPGKALAPILGRPALAHLLRRLQRAGGVDDIVVATTVHPVDEAIETLARHCGVRCYRGSEDDVMGRVVEAGASADADVLVEITGDCILLAPEVIDEALGIYRRSGYDVVSNTWKLTYPQGVDVQVFAWSLLAEAAGQTTDSDHREHVSLYFYEHPERYRIYHLEAPSAFRAPEWRFQLDYPEDLQFITAVYEALYPTNPDFTLQDIFTLLRQRPELRRLNAQMKEKPIRGRCEPIAPG